MSLSFKTLLRPKPRPNKPLSTLEGSKQGTFSSSAILSGERSGEPNGRRRGLCYGFQRGSCKKGDKCTYAHTYNHETSERKRKPDADLGDGQIQKRFASGCSLSSPSFSSAKQIEYSAFANLNVVNDEREAITDWQASVDSESLSPSQQRVVAAIQRGENVFFTGCAGTGKSFLLSHVIANCPQEGLFVTATTGLAAVNIKGITLHSFAGIGLAKGAELNIGLTTDVHID